jgi:hypothetical protein
MSHHPMFGTFTVAVDDLSRGPDTLQQRHDSRKRHRSSSRVLSCMQVLFRVHYSPRFG